MQQVVTLLLSHPPARRDTHPPATPTAISHERTKWVPHRTDNGPSEACLMTHILDGAEGGPPQAVELEHHLTRHHE